LAEYDYIIANRESGAQPGQVQAILQASACAERQVGLPEFVKGCAKGSSAAQRSARARTRRWTAPRPAGSRRCRRGSVLRDRRPGAQALAQHLAPLTEGRA